MKCRDCGHENPGDANFCGSCGSRLAQAEPCPECGRENPGDLRFCPGCGHQLAAAEDEAAPPQPAPPDAGATTHANGASAAQDAPREIAGGRYVVKDFLGEGGR